MEYTVFIIILAVLKESRPLNPEILKYDQYMKDFEATRRQIKQEAKPKEMDGLVMKRERLVISTVAVFSVIAESRFIAVSSLVGSEKFFIEPWFMYSDDSSPTEKNEICQDIIRSPLFDKSYQVDPVDPTNEEVFQNLEKNYPKIYKDLFEKQNSSNSSSEMNYTNPYRRGRVIVGKNVVHEDMFTCLAISRKSKDIVEYFISLAHSVNYLTHKPYEDRMKGFFVFTYNDKAQLTVIALAEEPGYIITPSDRRFNETLMDGFEDNKEGTYDEHPKIPKTLCGLSTYHKIRLCTLLLNIEEYRERVTFFPHVDNVDSQCHRGVIKFPDTANTSKPVQNDWMIGCRAVNVENNTTETYYVSAGFDLFDYFICLEPGGKKSVLGGIACRIEVAKKAKFPLYRNDEELIDSAEFEDFSEH